MLSKVKTITLILFILLSAFFWAFSSQEQPQPPAGCLIQPANLDEALTISLLVGDCRKVDFSEWFS